VIIAIVFQAIWGLTKTSVKTIPLAVIGVLALALNFAGADEVLILLVAGVLAIAITKFKSRPPTALIAGAITSLAAKAFAMATAVGEMAVSLPRLFFEFAKIGSVLYGSGYVLLAFIRTEFVEKLHWLTETQLLDAISVGQFTPGPVFTTATFVGYQVAGNQGAVLATLGIFLPAFVFVALSAPLISKIKNSPGARAFLDGVNVASLALMVTVTWFLGRSTLVDWKTLLLAAVSGLLLVRYRVNSAWLILAGGAFGALTLGI
jgi:chromate transporter